MDQTKTNKKQVNQSIIVTGASGAGKSYTAQSMIEYLGKLSIQKVGNNKDVIESVERLKELQKHADVILNAFGNAKTPRNDDSSRFGKYIQVHIDRNSGEQALFS